MRKVTLYEVKETEMVVSGDYVQMHILRKEPIFIRDGEYGMLLDVKTVDVPIVKYVVNNHATYLAISKELEKIVSIPFHEKIMRLEVDKQLLDQKAIRCASDMHVIEAAVNRWWSQSWHKRVWQAIKGKP